MSAWKPFNDDELRSLYGLGPFTLLMRENMPTLVGRFRATLDAERARAAEIEAQVRMAREQSREAVGGEERALADLAAAQAEAERYHGVLVRVATHGDGAFSYCVACGEAHDSVHKRECYVKAILAHAPGSRESLRAILERAVLATMKACEAAAGLEPGTMFAVNGATIVGCLLDPAGAHDQPSRFELVEDPDDRHGDVVGT